MATELDRALERLEPAGTVDAIEAKLGQAFGTFRLARTHVDTWDEFLLIVTRFLQHCECFDLGVDPSVLLADARGFWKRCVFLLEKAYGRRASVVAFEMARTGIDGGLYAVLKAILQQLAEYHAANQLRARAKDYTAMLSYEQACEAAKEYVGKYGHLLPAEVAQASPAALAADLSKLLQQHPYVLRRMKSLQR